MPPSDDLSQKIEELKTGNECYLCGVSLLERCNRELQQEITKFFDGDSPFEIEHHISYIPENTIYVCASCHNKIHNNEEYSHLAPSRDRPTYSNSIGSRRLDDYD